MASPHPLLFQLIKVGSLPGRLVTMDLIESAQEHRLIGYLSRTVQGPMEKAVSVRLMGIDMFEQASRRAVIKKAAEVHAAFLEAGVRHHFMKGTVEATRLFGHPGDRRFRDVDIVVHPSSPLSRAVEVIAPDHPLLGELDDMVSAGYRNTIGFRLEDVPIDLHTEALRTGPGSADVEAWWARTESVDVPGIGTVEALDLASSTLLFLIHQARDRFRYLNGALEFSRRVESDVDWAQVRSLAETEGIWEQAAVAVEVLARIAGVDTPVRVPANGRMWLWRRLWGTKVQLLGDYGRVRYNRRSEWLMPLTARGRSGATVRWVTRSAFPPDAHLRLKHPTARGPYLWRVLSARLGFVLRRRMDAIRKTGPSSSR